MTISEYEINGVDAGPPARPMTFIGIDPGQSGGIGWIRGEQANAIKMPATVKDVADAILERTMPVGRAFCVLELVHSMPKQGVVSSFKFGKVTGWVEGAVAALSIPYELVSPTKWQKEMGCLSRGDKNVTKRRAQQLFPAVEKDHSRQGGRIALGGLRKAGLVESVLGGVDRMSTERQEGELEYRPFKIRDCVIQAGDVRIIIDKLAGRVVVGTPEGIRSRVVRFKTRLAKRPKAKTIPTPGK